MSDWDDFRHSFLTEWTNILIFLGVFSRYEDLKWSNSLEFHIKKLFFNQLAEFRFALVPIAETFG